MMFIKYGELFEKLNQTFMESTELNSFTQKAIHIYV
jgi:hypothetical protein